MEQIKEIIANCKISSRFFWEQKNKHSREINRLKKLDYLDKTKSIIWNEKEKERLIRSERGKMGVANKKYQNAFAPVEEYIKEQIGQEHLNRQVVELVYQKAYEYGHDNGWESVYEYALEFAKFAESILDAAT